MTHPNIEKEFIEWFKDSHSDHSIKLLLAMVGTVNEFGNKWTIGDIWNWVIDFNILYEESKFGWIDRKGRFYGCGYAQHDSLIYDVLKTTVKKVETEGWVRVTLNNKIKCNKDLTRAQKSTLERIL